jgi:precorrin isomerase
VRENRGFMGAKTLQAVEIAKKSDEIARNIIPGDDIRLEILRRCIIATGDPSVKNIIAFRGEPEEGVKAIKNGAEIIVDVRMLRAGLRKEAIAMVEFAENGIETRVVSGLKKIKERVEGSVVGIGNAPSAAITLSEIAGEFIPAFIVATPVGFVNAVESKEMIRKLDVPSVTTTGTRGGSTICAAILNCLIDHAME